MIVALVVVLLGGGGGRCLVHVRRLGYTAGRAGRGQTEANTPQPSLYVGMPRPFVFNVAGSQQDRLVQIKIQLMVRGAPDETLAKQNIPLIEGTLLRVFSAATAEQLITFEGKEKLRQDSLEECRRVLNDLVSSP